MNNIKQLIKEEGRLSLYFLVKLCLIVFEEIVSFCSRIPKVLACSIGAFSVISFLMILMKGAVIQGLKVLLFGGVFAIFSYLISVLAIKPLNNLIFNRLEKIRKTHHDINCGIYVQKYKIKLLNINNLDRMLSLKELLETNILLSGLKLKSRLMFDDNNSLDYKNILSNGLCVGNALFFSPNTHLDNSDNTNKEFVIENDAFIKEFDKFCQKESNDIEEQILFLKENKKRISKQITN